MLIDAEADVNAQTDRGITALMSHKSPDATKLLIDAGANINARSADGRTALMYACDRLTSGCDASAFEKVKLLIDAGADITIKDNSNLTARDIAELNNFNEAAELLESILTGVADK
jgi:ankyrin repeat protein